MMQRKVRSSSVIRLLAFTLAGVLFFDVRDSHGDCSICPGSASACTVSGTVTVPASAILDCAGKAISISGALTTSAGTFALNAASLSVTSTGSIEATTSTNTETGFSISTTGNISILGQLRAENGGPGSSIELVSGGNVDIGGSVDPVIKCDGVDQAADGAEITIAATGSVHVYRSIWMSGKSGGKEANSNVGGELEISAGGDVNFHPGANVTAFGRHYGGGTVSLQATGTVRVDSTIAFDGTTPDAFGGKLNIVAGQSAYIGGTLFGQGASSYGGGQSAGGSVTIRSGCAGTTIAGTIDVTGGEEDGGDVTLDSTGNVAISGSVDASSTKNGGAGGHLTINAAKNVTVTSAGALRANGHASASSGTRLGGQIKITGCQVEILDGASSGAVIQANGRSGGSLAVSALKAPLFAGDATDFTIKVGNLSAITAAGQNGGPNGTTTLSVKATRTGWCQNQIARACQLNSECFVGNSPGQCLGANPDREGSNSQFTPLASIVSVPTFPACSLVCP